MIQLRGVRSRRNTLTGDGHVVTGNDNFVAGVTNEVEGDGSQAHGEGATVRADRTTYFNQTATPDAETDNDTFRVDADTIKLNGDVEINGVPVSPSGVADGDKGDITVSSSGAVWTIDNAAVTEAKIGLSDNTTNDVDTTKHGFTPKAPNDTAKFLRGDGAWAVPTSNAAAVDPSSISGLVLWLKADVGVYNDAGSTLATDTQTVQQWNDQSGNNNHVSQATSGKRPTFRTNIHNSLAVVRFNAAHCMTLASFALTTFTALVVVRGSGTAGVIYEHGATVASNDGCLLYQDSSGAIQVRKSATTSSRNLSTGWGVTGQYVIAGQHYAGSHATHYPLTEAAPRYAATGTGNEPGSGSVTATLNIGARNDAASLAMTGDICELLFYTPAITLQNVRAVAQYLQQRWNV